MAHESSNSLPSPPNDHETPGAVDESNHQYQMNPILDDRQEEGPYPDTGSPNALDRKNTQLPRNEDGKITCSKPACEGIVFERRCEWTKHMDRHERPYVCEKPGCEKLKGFTYAGGLIRHEREVHKQHGGPKETLMCPIPFCKRNTGHGFTRKENLNEHLRRVHRQFSDENKDQENETLEPLIAEQNVHPDLTDPSVQPGMSDQNLQGVATAFNPANNSPHMQSDQGLSMPPAEPSPAPSGKSRKRKSTAQAVRPFPLPPDVASLMEEIEHLRRDNMDKDTRITRLEETVRLLSMQVQSHNVQHPPMQGQQDAMPQEGVPHDQEPDNDEQT
ncbi:MAG: hypothetical protein M1831_002293 [Alyxoria varia]|nr:MAG: hypothetical protein M1831_002293 [Alyxoria varia]